MRYWHGIVWAALAMGVGTAAGCGEEGPAPGTDAGAEQRAAILETSRAWEEAAAREDADALAGLYTEDAIFIPPRSAPLVGRDAIREALREQFRIADVAVDFTTEEVVVAGEWAFRRGSYRGSGIVEASGDSLRVHDHFLEVWHRDADGRWRIARDMWNAASREEP